MTKIDGGLRALFRQNIPTFMWTSIETGGTGRGISDSNYLAAGGIEGWIEYKTTTIHAVGMRPEQVGWIDRRHRLGGRVWIAIRQVRKDGDFLHLIPGCARSGTGNRGQRHPITDHVRDLDRRTVRWNWADIQAILTIRGTSRR